MSGALVIAISALVLAGLPVTPIRTSSAATSLSALPWAVKIAPLASSRSPRSMPWPRGRAPTSRARLTPSKIVVGVVADLDAGQGRERAVVELHDDALERLQRRRDLQQPQLDRAVRAEQRAAREAEEQAVADLAGGTGDGDLEGGSAHGVSSSDERTLPTSATLAAAHRSLPPAGCACCRHDSRGGQASPRRVWPPSWPVLGALRLRRRTAPVGPTGVDELTIPTPSPTRRLQPLTSTTRGSPCRPAPRGPTSGPPSTGRERRRRRPPCPGTRRIDGVETRPVALGRPPRTAVRRRSPSGGTPRTRPATSGGSASG